MNKLKILIADDEEMLRDLYEMILESEFNCEFIKAENGLEAIEFLKNDSHFDVIISDYKMPLSTGGDIYFFNKSHDNIPFFLFSGGSLGDYAGFKDFHETNTLNKFFNKPFESEVLIEAISLINSAPSSLPITDQFCKIRLAYYAQHIENPAEVYIKLGDKFTKIITINDAKLADKELLNHYLKKNIEFIYLEKKYFKEFHDDIFEKFNQNIQEENKPESSFQISKFQFNVSVEGLNDVGISEIYIKNSNRVIEKTIDSLLNNSKSKDQFMKLCETEGFYIGHSLLIIYIAGRILTKSDLNYATTLTKISSAAFHHDISLFLYDEKYDEMKIKDIHDVELSREIAEHPVASALYLHNISELFDDSKKIIREHHELPNGDGYPKKLTATQIAPLSCLFIISQNITFCLIRNNFSKDRLKDYLYNAEAEFNQGTFAKFFKLAKDIF